MYKYKCAKCGGIQYSSSREKENEPCIYCGHASVVLEDEKILSGKEGDEIAKGIRFSNSV